MAVREEVKEREKEEADGCGEKVQGFLLIIPVRLSEVPD